MIYARQSTAIIVTVGPVLDADGVAVTGGVVADFTISKNGAAPAALNASATLTHRAVGFYSLSLTATDVNTVGTAEIVINDTVNACPMKEIQVVEEAVYDALFAASANGFAGAAGASTVTFSNTSIATVTTVTNQLTAAAIATGVWQDATAGDFTTASSIGKALYIANIVPGASGGHFISGSNAGTTTLGALTVTGTTTLAAVALTTLTASGAVAFQSTFAVTTSTALGAISGSTLTLSGAVAFQSTFAVTTSTSLAALSATTITASGTTSLAALTTSGTVTLNALTVSNVLTVSGATTLTGAVTATNAGNDIRGITVTALAANVITAASMNADASGEIADAVWDEDATGHQTTGTFGQAIGDPVADTNTIYGAVVTGAAGATIAADIIAIKAETAAILVDTTEIGVAGAGLTAINLPNQTMDIIGNITGNLSGSVGSVTGAVGSVTGSVGSVTGAVGSVTGDIGRLAAGAITDVEDAVWDAVLANHLDAGSTGFALNAAGSAGDPWGTALPGAYASGTAGHIIGTAIPDIAPGSANGLLRGGTNTATTFTTLTSTGAFTAGTNSLPWNAAWDAEVQSEVDDALVAQRLDELLNADSDIDGAAPPTVGSVFHELLTKTAASFTYDQTTDSLEALRDRGDAAWVTATGFSTITEAQVNAQVDIALADYDGPTNAEMEARTIVSANYATAANLATANTAVAAIKLKTDSLTFTVATVVDANIRYVNEIEVDGIGTTLDPWGPV